MIQVSWKIGKKKQGHYLTPIEFNIWLVDSEDLKYNPKLNIEKKYQLPDEISFTNADINPDGKIDNFGVYKLYKKCGSTDTLSIVIDLMGAYAWYCRIKSCRMEKTDRLLVYELKMSLCDKRCENCKPFLPWRPGIPDYSDFEAVFAQAAYDICEEWSKAVIKAKRYEGYEGKFVTITSKNYSTILQSN